MPIISFTNQKQIINYFCFRLIVLFSIFGWNNNKKMLDCLMELLMYFFLCLIAFIPATFFLLYIIAFDNYKPEPLNVVLLSVLLGIVSAIAVIWFGMPNNLGIIEISESHNWLDSIELGFMRLALPAELSKWMLLCIFLSLNKYYDEYIDGVVYSVCLAMGYAGVWGALFISPFWGDSLLSVIEKGLITALVLVPLHFIAGTVMGYFLALARESHRIRNHAFSLLFAVIIDGILCSVVVMVGNHWEYYFFVGVIMAILAMMVYTQIFRLLKKDLARG